MKATYVRVSTFEQNIARQLAGKEGEIYWDKVSPLRIERTPTEERHNEKGSPEQKPKGK